MCELYEFVDEILMKMVYETNIKLPFVLCSIVVIDLHQKCCTLEEELNSYFTKGIKI